MSAQRVKQVVYVIFLLSFIGLAVWLATIELEGALADIVARFGYVGYFVAASIAGINVFLPTSHLIFTAPLLNASLDPWALVACGAVGATLADGVGYFIGSTGRSAFYGSMNRVAQWLARVVAAHPRIAPVVLFLWAATVPLPNEILVIPAGVIGYGVARTFLITLSGNICFNIIAVQLGQVVT
jgi:membrane protein DedA with SNARE-associated domain